MPNKEEHEPNPVGRPPMFGSNDDLKLNIQGYFDQFDIEDPKERKIKCYETRPTVSGLCHFLGFESRQSFYAYESKGEFSYTIKRARLSIELIYENMLCSKETATGSIFALKNFGWVDRQEFDHTSSGERIQAITTMVDGHIIDLKAK